MASASKLQPPVHQELECTQRGVAPIPSVILAPLCYSSGTEGLKKTHLSILSRQERAHHSSKYTTRRAVRREGIQVWCKAAHPTTSLACTGSSV